MFIVRGVNVYPAAILSVVGDYRPRVTGRARVVRKAGEVSVTPPVPIEVEVPDGHESDPKLVDELTEAIHTKLVFRSTVTLVPETEFGEAGYKTKLTVSRS